MTIDEKALAECHKLRVNLFAKCNGAWEASTREIIEAYEQAKNMGDVSVRKDEVAQALVASPATSDVEMVRELLEAIQTAQLYTVPDPSKPIPPHIVNDLIMIDGVLAKCLTKATAWLAERER